MADKNSHLLSVQELADLGPPEAVRLPLDLIDENPDNPRKALVEIDQLAASIGDPDIGLLQPIVVRRQGDRYQVLGGHRRLAAFRLLADSRPHEVQWKTIPAVVRRMESDESAYLALLSAQVHIRPFSPKEEAAALERLVVAGRSVSEVGQALHRTVSWASTRLRIYSDAVLSGYVQTERIPPGVAQELLLVKDPTTRRELAEAAAQEHWGLDYARGRVRALRLDRQLSQLGRDVRALLDTLSTVEARSIPMSVARDLEVLRGRIEILSGRRSTRVPTIEEAQRAAGVRSQERPLKRGVRRRPGYNRRSDGTANLAP